MARDQPNGSSTRDERWLLATPRTTSLANRVNGGGSSQAYMNLGGDDGQLEESYRRQSSLRSANGVAASKSRAVYFDDSQQYVRSTSASRDIGQRDSPIIGELKTNVIIKDEFTLVTDLSYHLANRYSRPESCVMIKVDHSACLALGGVFDPCYILSISALPFQLSSTSNRRNAAIIQAFMADILSVPADRGIIKFQPVDEGSMAMNGTTMIGETERNENRLYEDDGTSIAVRRAISHANRKSLAGAKNTMRVDTSASSDSYYKRGLSAVERANLERKRKSIPEEPEPPSPGPHDPMPNVFELPATGSRSPMFDEDVITPPAGLDGMTREDLVRRSTRLANGRPQTVGGHEVEQEDFDEATSDDETRRKSMARLSQPVVPTAMSTRIAAAERFGESMRPEQKSLLSQAMPPNISFRAAGEDRPSSGAGYDSQAGRTSNFARQLSPTFSDKASFKLDSRGADNTSRETGANVAKRRSTMTATPNLPAPTPPPPVPATETSSLRGPKGLIGKRKSFLAAFRRSATTS